MFQDFLDLEDCIKDSDPEQLFCYVHKNVDDIVVTSTPHNLKWTEFMKMYGTTGRMKISRTATSPM